MLLAGSLTAMASHAGAQEDASTRAAARKLAEDGVAALQAGDGAKASEKLDKAFRILHVPSIALWSGRALVKQGQLVEAAERFLAATRLPVSGDTAVQEQAKTEAAKELEQLRPRIPNLVIRVDSGANVSVSLDGKDVPPSLLGEEHPLNPGAHQLVARRGGEQKTEAVNIAEGERKEVTLRFDEPAATPSARLPLVSEPPSSAPAGSVGSSRTLAFVALGLGGAGLVLGGVSGALAMSKKSSLDDDDEHCRNDQCVYAVEDDVSSLRTFRTVSTIGFIAGGALAATGVVLLLTHESPSSTGQRAPSPLALSIGLSAVQVRGSF